MLPTTGTTTINGQEYTWRSPKLKHLAEVEHLVGPITALATVNSVRGRAYLAYACLRDDHPNIMPGIILDWPATAFEELWAMIVKAIPIYGGGGTESAGPSLPPVPAESAEASPPTSSEASSLPSSSAPAGIPSEPESSA
jgi:hypothetical protein